ncbi:hypothetical protein PG985_001380 [Apiospora marii]|uniref:uncharacterized protein n=1 Tax=Apiospora marii TaxID=335849 RepID=UPI00312D65DE
MVLASYIPLLQPILEPMLGRRVFSSRTGWKQYGRYGSNPDATKRPGGRSGYQLSLQTERRRLDMGNVLSAAQTNDSGSQERLLVASGGQSVCFVKVVRHGAVQCDGGTRPQSQLGGIVRTDEFSVFCVPCSND